MMQPPPRDTSGNTQPHDSAEIANEDWLVRGVSPYFFKNGRLSSGVFKSSSKKRDPFRGLSVDLIKLAPTKNYYSEKYIGAVKFRAEVPRATGLSVGYDPMEDNICHCQIWRIMRTDGVEKIGQPITGAQSSELYRNWTWHSQPT